MAYHPYKTIEYNGKKYAIVGQTESHYKCHVLTSKGVMRRSRGRPVEIPIPQPGKVFYENADATIQVTKSPAN